MAKLKKMDHRWDLGAKTGSNKQFCVEMAQIGYFKLKFALYLKN